MAAFPESCSSAQVRVRALRVMLAAPAGAEGALLEALVAGSPAAELVARAESESGAMQLYFRARPDLTVLDSRVALHEPARFIGLLKRMAPDASVIAVVPELDSMPARAARALGADAVATAEGLAGAIETLARARGPAARTGLPCSAAIRHREQPQPRDHHRYA